MFDPGPELFTAGDPIDGLETYAEERAPGRLATGPRAPAEPSHHHRQENTMRPTTMSKPCPECGAPTGAPCTASCASRRLLLSAWRAIPRPGAARLVLAIGAIITTVGAVAGMLASHGPIVAISAVLELAGVLLAIIGIVGLIDGDPTLERHCTMPGCALTGIHYHVDDPDGERIVRPIEGTTVESITKARAELEERGWAGFPVRIDPRLQPGEIRIEPRAPRERRLGR